ncbi:MAG: adenylyl-sulfate kinase [Lachnospiraceae bacterium]|nr:adenylyl-sulfate kinase [Lachnospiraceae bacterium]
MNDLLKFITCGSVDDGKSTLIGHMLYDAKLIFLDQKQALELDSKVGSRSGAIDYSLLLDGLMAEREQGITIDVAYRYFTTEHRSFIVADTPGHEEYTKNMAVGASFADLAIILVDMTQGILTQTRRHARICALMGIHYFCFAVNKMDLLQYRQKEYLRIEKEIKKLAIDLELDNVTIIPVSATEGDNITYLSDNMAWYQGRTLLDYLETIDIKNAEDVNDFVMPIQRVCRPNHAFRGFEGQVETGNIRIGEEVMVLPSRETAHIKDILVAGEEKENAGAGMPVTVTLDREIDASRGCVIAKEKNLTIGNLFTAQILWMDDEVLTEGKGFILKLGTKEIPAFIIEIKYKIDINSGEQLASKKLYKNEIAVCNISTAQPIVYMNFEKCRPMGSFILIDRISDMTSACGVIMHPLRRADNVVFQETDITRKMRSVRMNQNPITIWFTGLSGAGKSTIANALEQRLFSEGRYTMLLDGDNVRMGLNKNLGFEPEDRIENIRRVAEVSRLMNDAGLIVLTAFISPYERDRENAREIIGKDNFVEIYISTPLEVCMKRDVKGLYKKANNKEIPNFTGVSGVYEKPVNPDIMLNTEGSSVDACVNRIMEYLWKR